MKKVASLLIVAMVLFSFASCENDTPADTSSDNTSSIVYNSLVPEYAAQGKIDTVVFAVGANVDEVVEYYNGDGPKTVDEGGGTSSDADTQQSDSDAVDSAPAATESVESELSSTETISIPELDQEIVYNLTIRGLDTNDRIIKMYAYDTRYFYYNASPDSGIAYIAQSIDSFGYMIGHTTYNDVKTTVEATPTFDGKADVDDMFFMVEPLDNSRILSYQYGDFMLNFFFDGNDKLFYTTIYNIHVWTE